MKYRNIFDIAISVVALLAQSVINGKGPTDIDAMRE